MTRGEKVIAFAEKYLLIPEGEHVGKPLKLLEFQKKFILDIYDNPEGTRRAYLSIARKNGKTTLIAGILLAHICGPEATLNSQIISGAMSREQAAIVFDLACKMILLNPKLVPLVKIIPSSKKIIGLVRNVHYRALSADGKTAHGLSPTLAILDEVGQIRGPQSDFVDAITTSQGAHKNPLLIAISTQAALDTDLFSVWVDDALQSKDKRMVCHVYQADKDAGVMDPKAWEAANPAMGEFKNFGDVEEQAKLAERVPSFEPTFRNLYLNQRVEVVAPFISKGVWTLNSQEVDESAFYEYPVYCGLDLSSKNDLTAFVLITFKEKWHVKCIFWTPEKGLQERAKRDKAPYLTWAQQGILRPVKGASIDYEVVAKDILEIIDGMDVHAIAFDRWRIDLLKKEFNELNVELPLMPYGQGFKDMAPAIDTLEGILLNEQMAHGNNPVLTMCMANTKIVMDAPGNRKIDKQKSNGRIDGAVALAMAVGVTPQLKEEGDFDGFISNPVTLK